MISPVAFIVRLLVAFACLVPMTVFAQDVRTVDVKFPRGESGTTINETISGRQSVNYRVGVAAGQQMSVQLDADSPNAYFNVTAPGASEALFNGSISGNGTTFVVPSSGNYVVNVYLMRNAARRGETANYALTLYVEGRASSQAPAQRPRPAAPQPNPAPSRVDTSLMPRYCQGEASAKFSVRPQDLTTNMAFKSGNNYVVQGNFDNNGSTTFFNCWFGLDGSFGYIN